MIKFATNDGVVGILEDKLYLCPFSAIDFYDVSQISQLQNQVANELVTSSEVDQIIKTWFDLATIL